MIPPTGEHNKIKLQHFNELDRTIIQMRKSNLMQIIILMIGPVEGSNIITIKKYDCRSL
jgi:hypothetical protein